LSNKRPAPHAVTDTIIGMFLILDSTTIAQVGDERFNSSQIQRLYEANDYPLRKPE
jgi:hypothetical protein